MSRDSIKNKLFNDKYKSVSQQMQDQLEPIFNDKEQPVQDESDGLLFFHSHSLWTVLKKVEEFYECKTFLLHYGTVISFFDISPLKLLSHLISSLIVFGEPDTLVIKT